MKGWQFFAASPIWMPLIFLAVLILCLAGLVWGVWNWNKSLPTEGAQEPL